MDRAMHFRHLAQAKRHVVIAEKHIADKSTPIISIRYDDGDGLMVVIDVRTAEQLYTTPDQSHSMMEPHASMAEWSGDEPTVWTSAGRISQPTLGMRSSPPS